MKTGRTLQELAQEVARQATSKVDYLADTSRLGMLNGSELILPADGSTQEFGITELAHRQIGTHLDIPRAYYERLRVNHPTLLDHNVNGLFRAEPTPRMVRTLDGNVRAFLSNRYRRLDNEDLLERVLPILTGIPEVRVESCEVTDTRLYLKVVAPRIQGEVKKGDVVQAGLCVQNSEVGLGSLVVSPLVFRLVCLNGMIAGSELRRHHVGRANEVESMELYRDDTLRADDHAFWLKVRDTVTAAVTETNFQRLLQKMQAAANGQTMAEPIRGVEELANRFSLNDLEKDSVLRHLIEGGDLSRWGALNAITRASQDVPDYDRATELEQLGGMLLNIGERDWIQIATASGSSDQKQPRRRQRSAVMPTADDLIAAIS